MYHIYILNSACLEVSTFNLNRDVRDINVQSPLYSRFIVLSYSPSSLIVGIQPHDFRHHNNVVSSAFHVLHVRCLLFHFSSTDSTDCSNHFKMPNILEMKALLPQSQFKIAEFLALLLLDTNTTFYELLCDFLTMYNTILSSLLIIFFFFSFFVKKTLLFK